MERAAKLFKNGGSRAVRIPREFKLEGDDVVLTQHGDGVLVRPRRSNIKALLDYLEAEGPLSPEERLPEIADTPPRPVDL